MHRIDGPGATVDNKFTEGSPGVTEATTVTDDWLNDVQEELITLLATAGITPVKGTQNQVLAAINDIILSAFGQGGTSANDYVKIPYRDKTTGVRRELIVQWVSQGSGVSAINWPIQFPNGLFWCGIGEIIEATGNYYFGQIPSSSLTGATGVIYGAAAGVAPAATAQPYKAMAIGW